MWIKHEDSEICENSHSGCQLLNSLTKLSAEHLREPELGQQHRCCPLAVSAVTLRTTAAATLRSPESFLCVYLHFNLIHDCLEDTLGFKGENELEVGLRM